MTGRDSTTFRPIKEGEYLHNTCMCHNSSRDKMLSLKLRHVACMCRFKAEGHSQWECPLNSSSIAQVIPDGKSRLPTPVFLCYDHALQRGYFSSVFRNCLYEDRLTCKVQCSTVPQDGDDAIMSHCARHTPSSSKVYTKVLC